MDIEEPRRFIAFMRANGNLVNRHFERHVRQFMEKPFGERDEEKFWKGNREHKGSLRSIETDKELLEELIDARMYVGIKLFFSQKKNRKNRRKKLNF